MTDSALVASRAAVKAIEDGALARLDDPIDRDAAHGVFRQAVALRRVLDEWIVNRAIRAQQAASAR